MKFYKVTLLTPLSFLQLVDIPTVNFLKSNFIDPIVRKLVFFHPVLGFAELKKKEVKIWMKFLKKIRK